MAGQIKSVKPSLKQLQQSIQTITQPNWPSDEGITVFFKLYLINI